MTIGEETITIYGLMFGAPVCCTLGEIDQLFRGRFTHELVFEAGFGVTIGTAFDRAFSSDDPKTLAVAATIFGPVALELDSRGLAFPIEEPDRLGAFETWKRVMVSDDEYARLIPTHRLVTMRQSITEAIQRIGPWGEPVLLGSLVQSVMVVDMVIEGRDSENVERTPDAISHGPDNEQQIPNIPPLPPPGPQGDRPNTGQPPPVSTNGSSLSGDKSQPTSSVDTNTASIFIAYAHKDSAYRDELDKHLSPLRRSGKISDWYDRKILPGQDWESQINEHLNQADLIILLISADFINSEYCYGVELQRALQKHEDGSAVVVPVVIRPVFWRGQPFAHIQMLPTDAKPVANWKIHDNAWVSVVAGIQQAIALLAK